MMGLPAALRSAPAPPPRTSPNRYQEGAVPDQATMKWEAALELLAASGELGPGKVSVLRMTRVIDVDGVLVLVVGFAFARNIIACPDGSTGFIDFEEDPGQYMSFTACESRDYLCYLQSTADILLRSGPPDQAAEHYKTCLQKQNPAIIRTLRRSMRPILWMRHIQSERWGCDTLRLAALADLFYRMGEI